MPCVFQTGDMLKKICYFTTHEKAFKIDFLDTKHLYLNFYMTIWRKHCLRFEIVQILGSLLKVDRIVFYMFFTVSLFLKVIHKIEKTPVKGCLRNICVNKAYVTWTNYFKPISKARSFVFTWTHFWRTARWDNSGHHEGL